MLTIDRLSRSPVYEQIISQFERLIANGSLKEYEQLPSVRALSQQLTINPNTIQKAYVEMERRGLCKTAQGSGRFVAGEARELIEDSRRKELSELKPLLATFLDAGITRHEIQQGIEDICNMIEAEKEGGMGA